MLSIVNTKFVVPAYALPAKSLPATVTVAVPSLPAGTFHAYVQVVPLPLKAAAVILVPLLNVIVIVGVAVIDSLKVAVIVSVSASRTIKSEPLCVNTTVGGVVSTVTLPVPADDVFPAASVAVAVTLYVPDGSVLVVILQLPLEFAVVVYVDPFTLTVTIAFASAVPVIVGVTLFVVRLFTTGADGAVLSITSVPVPTGDTLPAASVAVAVTLYVPDGSVLVVILQLPLEFAVVVYVDPFTLTVTIAFASAVPVIVGVTLFVV